VQVGESYSDAYAYAAKLQEERGLTFVHPFDDPYVIAGQGTVAMEILSQHQGPIHAIFVPIGGGGLAAGVAAYVKSVRPEIKVIGVQTDDSCAMAQSLKAGERVTLNEVGLFSDGTAVKLVGEETFRLCREYLDDVLIVNTDALCAAIKDVFQDTRSVLEPAGSLAVAGAKQYAEREGIEDQTLIAVTSGANMNFDRMRFVAERAEVGEAREAVFAVTIPEERGSFKRFCELVGTRSVTEFNYRIAEASSAHIFVGVQIRNRSESAQIAGAFEAHGFATVDLTSDELSKQHIRYMVGGRSPLAHDERLFRFEFPERPGALMKFLSSMAPNWNISLFHYRNQGPITARSWSASRCLARRTPSSTASSRRSAIRIGKRRRTRSTGYSSHKLTRPCRWHLRFRTSWSSRFRRARCSTSKKRTACTRKATCTTTKRCSASGWACPPNRAWRFR
jgi:threonine dehydratase